MKLYLFIERDTVLHRLHPVVRVIGMAVFFASAYSVEKPLWMLPIIAILIGLHLVAGSLENVRRLRILFIMAFLMTILVWTLFYGPDAAPPLFQVWKITISGTSPIFAVGMALKLVSFLGAGVLFLSITRIEDFAYALTKFGLPYKAGFTITLAFRLVPVFLESAVSVVQAQRCRGLDFDHGSIWQRLKRYVPVIVPVFMGALRRADNMAMALEARGFQSGADRSSLEAYPFGSRDIVALLFLSALVSFYATLRWHGMLSLTPPV